jgi:putative heme-binding domain-containing protein
MSILRYLSFLGCFGGSLLSAWLGGAATGQTFRPVDSLETLLKQTPSQRLSQEIHRRGDPARGALVFYRSAAACVRCHASGDGPSPLGPNLADLSKGLSPDTLTDEYLIRALLYPSADIREEFAVHTLRTDEGLVVSGLIESEDEQQLTLRSAAEIDKPIRLAKANIEARSRSPQSMMPEGLISSFREVGDFYDLVAYVMAVARGGMAQAAALKPSAEQLAIKEDWSNLDHAGILSRLKSRDFESGKAIYHGYCVDCHGPDGNRPNLPAARAFGTQPMKFGADPFRIDVAPDTTPTLRSGALHPRRVHEGKESRIPETRSSLSRRASARDRRWDRLALGGARPGACGRFPPLSPVRKRAQLPRG